MFPTQFAEILDSTRSQGICLRSRLEYMGYRNRIKDKSHKNKLVDIKITKVFMRYPRTNQLGFRSILKKMQLRKVYGRRNNCISNIKGDGCIIQRSGNLCKRAS